MGLGWLFVGGLPGMIGTWASMPRGARSLLYGLAGLLLLPLLGSFSLFALGFKQAVSKRGRACCGTYAPGSGRPRHGGDYPQSSYPYMRT